MTGTKINKGFIIVGFAIIAMLWIIAIIFINPESSAIFPQCAFKYITGYDCPGCGSQRAIYQLINLNIVEAWRYNPLLFLVMPYLLLLFYLQYLGGRDTFPKLYAVVSGKWAGYIVFFVIVTYWVIRNL